MSEEDETAFSRLITRARQIRGSADDLNGIDEADKEYEFDRKFLFRVLVLGNAQLAQLCGARGPNAQTNAACAGTTQVRQIPR